MIKRISRDMTTVDYLVQIPNGCLPKSLQVAEAFPLVICEVFAPKNDLDKQG